MPYHVRITPSGHSRISGDELALDLTHDQLERRFLEPRRTGQPLSLNGRTLRWEEIDRVRINETEEESAQLLPLIRTERATGSVVTLIPDEWYVTKEGRGGTDRDPSLLRGNEDPKWSPLLTALRFSMTPPTRGGAASGGSSALRATRRAYPILRSLIIYERSASH